MRETLLLVVAFMLFTTVSVVGINTATQHVPNALGFCDWCCIVTGMCCPYITSKLNTAQDNFQWVRSRMIYRPWMPDGGGGESSGYASQLTSVSLDLYFPHISGQMATSAANLNETLKYMEKFYDEEILPSLSRGEKYVKRPPDFNMAPLKPFYRKTLKNGLPAQKPNYASQSARRAYKYASEMYKNRATNTVSRFHDLKEFESAIIPRTKDVSIKEGLQLLTLVQAYNQMLVRERASAKARLLETRARSLSYPESVRDSQPRREDSTKSDERREGRKNRIWELFGFD